MVCRLPTVIDELGHRLGETRHQRLERDQASQRQRALDHAQAADAENGRDRQSRKQRRQHVEKDRGGAEFLLGVQRLGLDSGPLTEGFVLQAAGFEGFDAAHGADGGADQLALLQREAAAEILRGAPPINCSASTFASDMPTPITASGRS